MAQQQMLLADVNRPLEQDLLISDEEESDDGDDSGNVSSNLDKFNMSFEKDQAFWKNASESLDEDEYLEFVKVNTRKPNDLEKFNKSFKIYEFGMEGLKQVRDLIQEGAWFCSMNLKVGRFLRSQCLGSLFEW